MTALHMKRLISVLVLVASFGLVLQAQSTSKAWEVLDLESIHLDRATVYYEKAFEPNLPIFKKAFSDLLSSWDKSKAVQGKRDTLLAEINQILGIKAPDAKLQHGMWASLMGAFSSIEDITFYLIKQQTIKEYLRKGGSLPDFTYDKAKDEVTYNFNISASTKDGPLTHLEWACPIKSEQTFEKDMSTVFEILERFVSNDMVDMTLHEITEISLLKKVRPTDPYCRWFSDGMANAITFELLKKHFGMQRAEAFAETHDVKEYADLKTDVNLRYWLAGSACLLLQDAPTEPGQRLNYARYAYATLEAQGLIDRHGIDCISKILDNFKVKPSRTGQDLLDAIQQVTDESIEDRLSQYQTFQTRQEGLEKYIPAFNEASQKKDRESMLLNLFRLHDMRLPSEVQQLLGDYRYAAQLVFRTGNEQDADKVMDNCVRFFSNPGYKNGRLMTSEAFIVYALETGKPLKAVEHAEELLKHAPDHVNALTIRMLACMNDKQLSAAQDTAKRIIGLVDNRESKQYQLASSILAFHPGQPDSKASR